MSVLERLKALILGAKNDVIKNISDEEVLNQRKPKKPNDLSKQTSSDTKVEEKADYSVANDSKNNDVIETVANEEISIDDESSKKVVVSTFSSVKEESGEIASEKFSENENNEESFIKTAMDQDSNDMNAEEKIVEEDNKASDVNDKEEKRDNMTLLDENNEKLTLDSVDKDFTQIFIDAGIDTVEHCFQCGTCTGGCPSGRRTPYRVRQLVRNCLMGLKEEVISDPSLWMCSTCYTCQERCPREIKIVEIVKMARNEAAKAGYMAPAHKATGSFVIKTGHGVPINDATMELRKRVGLDELPPTTHSYPEALEEVQKICEATNFDSLIGFNMKTGELE